MKKSLDEIASLVLGTVVGGRDAVISSIAPVDEAGPGDIAFIWDRRYLKSIKTCAASAVIIREEDYKEGLAPDGVSLLLVKNPQLAFAMTLDVFRPQTPPPPGVHPAASVHPGARIGKDVSIMACAVVEEGAEIGEGAVLFPGVYVGRDAAVGAGAVLHAGVAVRERCLIGRRVIIHCNSVVGSDGFGYARESGGYRKIPQTGMVRIEDDVEIGACVTIDRATVGETVIGRGTKIDNLVQIAHNVRVGADSIIVAQTGIAGSTKVGSRVQLGGQSGIVGHIEIGDDVMIGARAGVIDDVAKGSVVSGFPAMPHGEWLRAQSLFLRLPEMKKKISELERRLAELEKGGNQQGRAERNR
ncbi:MAG: UDP-3-O-(3-hydroxymyristoyl)glucosamine N-acyltransferase [Deltaproteobacteria bacterium]|nr:UDP-3-O-(3-hydroxymyristoyl)glucosamine N-acyltransferase [Deltaproteobacteria bacterium]